MTEDEAVRILREMCEKAPRNEKGAYIHIFGIKYAQELAGLSISTVAERATGYKSYEVEINKGIRLAKYVRLRDDQL